MLWVGGKMKKLIVGLVFSVIACGAQASSLEIVGGAPLTFKGFNGVPEETVGPYSSGQTGAIHALIDGLFTATFLGSESEYDNFFQFGLGDSILTKNSAIGDTISMSVEAGLIDFSFVNNDGKGTLVENGKPLKKSWFHTLLGINPASFVILDGFCDDGLGCFEYLLGFNDQFKSDADYDDFVVGINLSAHPAPVPLPAAAWLFGSALLGFGAAARRKSRLAKNISESL